MAFDLSQYEPVADRIARFWEQYPNGRIATRIIERTEKDIIVEAEIYTDRDDARPVTNDFAQESIGLSQITKHSWLETCTTSAIGRALGDLNFAAKKNGKIQRPSREEINKVERHQERDYLGLAQKIMEAGDILALKDLYRTAKAENADKGTLEAIETLGKTITPSEG